MKGSQVNPNLLELLDRPIAFHRVFADLTGSIPAALLLSQALYWQRRCPAGRDGWWWKTSQEWFEEARLTRREQQKARKILVNLGILEEDKKGLPRRLWFRLNLDKLLLLIQNTEIRQTGRSDIPVSRDAAGKFVQSGRSSLPQKRQTITETTSETTKEEAKNHPAFGGQAETYDDESKQVLELEMQLGVCVPKSLASLQNPSRISHILQKANLGAEAVRLVFAEFDACCRRTVVTDPWALFMALVRKAEAQELHLSAEGEKQMPRWA